jgi:hypothetical protein
MARISMNLWTTCTLIGFESRLLGCSRHYRFRTRCKAIADTLDLRELQFKSILRHKDAEIAHLQAKHEVERKRAEAEASRCRTLTNQVSTFSNTEAELRSQLNIYVEKFKQVSTCSPFYPFGALAEISGSPSSRLKTRSITATSSS